jgi:hypothetical protein
MGHDRLRGSEGRTIGALPVLNRRALKYCALGDKPVQECNQGPDQATDPGCHNDDDSGEKSEANGIGLARRGVRL